MADRNLRLRILMDAADRVSRPLRDITGGSRRAADALRGTRQELQKISDARGQIDAFRTLKDSMRGSSAASKRIPTRAALSVHCANSGLTVKGSPPSSRRRKKTTSDC